jgi:FkbM family methyltransferase
MSGSLIQKCISLVPWRFRASIKHLPLIAPLQRWLIAQFLDGREFIHRVDAGPARGVTFPVRLPDDKGIWTGTYEQKFAAELAKLVRPDDVCCDVGGWHGFFGAVMAACGASHVYIFEPMPDNCGRISKMIDLNPDLPIELVEAAAGAKDGEARFRVMPESSMGKLAESTFQPGESGEREISVTIRSLDRFFLGGRANPSMMKIDVEGAEVQVLRGAQELIAASRPRLLIEVHSRVLARECADLLADSNYGIRVLETGEAPDGRSEPEVCHFVALPNSTTPQKK